MLSSFLPSTRRTPLSHGPWSRLRMILVAMVLMLGWSFPAAAVHAAGTWVSHGPAGRISNSLAINPATTSTLYTGTDAGVFKSTNSGGSWTPMSSGLPLQPCGGSSPCPPRSVLSLVHDAHDTTPGTLYAGIDVGDNAIGNGTQLFKSTNGAASWQPTSLPSVSGGVPALALDTTTNPSTLYAAVFGPSSTLVYKSTDGGVSFTAVGTNGVEGLVPPNGNTIGFLSLAISQSNPAILYGGTSLTGVYRTLNGGGTWQNILSGLPSSAAGAPFGVRGVAIHSSDPTIVYAATLGGGIFRLTGAKTATPAWVPANGGSSLTNQNGNSPWTAPSGGFGTLTTPGGLGTPSTDAVAVDPTDSSGNTVYAGTQINGVWKSTDGGASWVILGDHPVNGNVQSLMLGNTNIVYGGTSGDGVMCLDQTGGSGCGGSSAGGGDTTAPTTTIDTHPTNPTTDTSAGFTFHAADPDDTTGFTFACKLDTGAFATCNSQSASYTGLAPGPHTFSVHATDPAHNIGMDASFGWTITSPIHATTTAVGCQPSPVLIGVPATCIATVTDISGSPTTPTGSVGFTTDSSGTFGSTTCTLAGTGSSATCSVAYTPAVAGGHTIGASYGGDAGHYVSGVSTQITATKRPTSMTVSCSPAAIPVGQPTTCTATVTDTAPGAAQTPTGAIRFSGGVGTFASGGACTLAGTGASARCAVAFTPNGLGPQTVSAAFNGDAVHLSSNGSTPADGNNALLVFAFATPSGGTFVIGDRNAAPNTHVTYWGAQWAKQNSMSGGAGPDAFKGFDNSAPTLACEATWTTDPGNASDPPATIPAYMAVIVSSHVEKSGSTISGDIVKIVVVKTDAGYAGNPGHAGTGTIVGTYCGQG